MNLPKLYGSIRRRIPLSRDGIGWLILTVAMLLTGLIKSINLITLLACILIAGGLLNLVLARRQVVDLSAERETPDFLMAQTANPWVVRLRQKRVRGRHGVYLVDPWPDAPLVWFIDLSPAPEQTFAREIIPARRGIVTLGPIAVHSGYPFGFAASARALAPGATMFIAPRLGQLQRGLLRRWLSRRSPTIGAVRSHPLRHPSGQMEFHGLRMFRAGDSPRLIHWRTSARRGELMVREFEEYPNDDLVLIVDLTLANPADEERFERMLSLAATIAWEWCRQKGDWLTMILAGAAPRRLSGATGTLMRAEIMRALAGVEPVTGVDPDAVIAALQQTPAPATAHLLLSVGPSVLADPLEAVLRHVLAALDVMAGSEAAFFELAAESRPIR
jgi:uncharacterized protein (DUF58 family)